MRGLLANWQLKLFSLAAAVVLFLFVGAESGTPIEVAFPIEYHLPSDIMVINDPPDELHATLRGPWAAFRGMFFDQREPVVVDLTGAEPGHRSQRVELGDVRAPGGMTAVSVRPSVLDLTLDRRVEKLVSVEIDRLGRPAFGYEIGTLRSDPSKVRVVGPLSKVQALDFIYTRPIDLRDRDADLELDVDLSPPQPPMRLVDRRVVRVFAQVVEEISERSVEVGVRMDNAPKGTRVDPERVTVTLKGPRRILDGLNDQNLAAVVDAQPEVEDVERPFEKSVQLNLPDRTQVVGVLAKVTITPIKKRKKK